MHSLFPSPTIFRLSLIRQFAPFLVRMGPPWLRRKLVQLIPHDAVQKLKGMSETMHEKAVEIVEFKRTELKYDSHGDEAHEGRLKDIITALSKLFIVFLQSHELSNITEQYEQMSQLLIMKNSAKMNSLDRLRRCQSVVWRQ
jgi:hypothetical protein